jgi:hypothetical protein
MKEGRNERRRNEVYKAKGDKKLINDAKVLFELSQSLEDIW